MSVKNSRLRPSTAWPRRLPGQACPPAPAPCRGAGRRCGAADPAATGCNSTESADQASNTVGSYVVGSGSSFFVDGNFGGLASSMRIAQQYYGGSSGSRRRLAPMPRTAASTLHEDFVIDPRPEDAWNEDSYALETNPVTGEQVLFIKADYNDTTMDLGEPETGRQRFVRLLKAADAGTRVVADNGFGQADLHHGSAQRRVRRHLRRPRRSRHPQRRASVRVQVGDPAVTPFEAACSSTPTTATQSTG